MVGVIGKRDICAHPLITIRSFGWRIFWHVMIAGHDQTFLELVTNYGHMASPQVNVSRVIGRCIKLELRAKRLYERLAARLVSRRDICSFFQILSGQEQNHADLLNLCSKLATKKHWRYREFDRWNDMIPKLEEEMNEVERQADKIDSEKEALRLTLQIEGSEINSLFSAVIDATDSSFVRSMEVFRQASHNHIDYIFCQVVKLDPELQLECEGLRDQYCYAD